MCTHARLCDFLLALQVDQLASSRGIHLRTGCFCNTGACQIHLGIDTEQIKRNLEVCAPICGCVGVVSMCGVCMCANRVYVLQRKGGS